MVDVIEIKAENLGGESVSEGTVKVCKNVGDQVKKDEVIFIIDTDKTSLELVSPESGTVAELSVNDGDTITRGQSLAKLKVSGVASSSSEKAESTFSADSSMGTKKTSTENNNGRTIENNIAEKKNSPSATKLMSEHSINTKDVVGSGKGDRIVKSDVLDYLSNSKAVDNKKTLVNNDVVNSQVSNSSREERVKMSRIRQIIASRLKESQNTAAILSTFNEIDMHNVMLLRAKYKEVFEKKYNIKLGFMSFFVKAVTLALREFPVINAEISGDEIIYKYHYDIGVAVGSDKGLVVPVIRDADTLSFAELEIAISEFGKKAKSGKLQVSDMQGATFTISNGGVYGSLLSTPIINPPQSGILGMHAIQKRPVVIKDAIEIRPMMYVALSYDHRIVDGQGAVSFLVRVKEYIEDPSRLMLEV